MNDFAPFSLRPAVLEIEDNGAMTKCSWGRKTVYYFHKPFQEQDEYGEGESGWASDSSKALLPSSWSRLSEELHHSTR